MVSSSKNRDQDDSRDDWGFAQARGTAKDYRASVEKLRKDAIEAASIRDISTDEVKRDMFDRLHQHFNSLADEVEQVLNSAYAGRDR